MYIQYIFLSTEDLPDPTTYLESVQDFLIKLDMKPFMYLVEISICTLNHVMVRLTKIMNNLLKHLKIRTFKVIFLFKKLVESFHKKGFYEEYWTRRPTFIKKCFLNRYLIYKVFIFVGSVHNFGRCKNDRI